MSSKNETAAIAVFCLLLTVAAAFVGAAMIATAPDGENEKILPIEPGDLVTETSTIQEVQEEKTWTLGVNVNTTVEFANSSIRDCDYTAYQLNSSADDDYRVYEGVYWSTANDSALWAFSSIDSNDDDKTAVVVTFLIEGIRRTGTLYVETYLRTVNDTGSQDTSATDARGISITEGYFDNRGYLRGEFYLRVAGSGGNSILDLNLLGENEFSNTELISDSTGFSNTYELFCFVDYISFVPDPVVYVERSEYLDEGSNCLHRFSTENLADGSIITIYKPDGWNYVSANPVCAATESSTTVVMTNTVEATYYWLFSSNNSQYLAIKDVSSEYLDNRGFENGYSIDWGNGYSIANLDTALNSTIVNSGVNSLKMQRTGSAGWSSIRYTFSTPVDLYLSGWCYEETEADGSSDFRITIVDWDNTTVVNDQPSSADRWSPFFYYVSKVHTIDIFAPNDQDAAFVDNVRFFISSTAIYSEASSTVIKPVIRNLDGYDSDPVPYNKINVTLGVRADNSTLLTWNITTNAAGEATIRTKTVLEAKEYFIRAYSYKNSFTGDNGSQKSYFTPIAASYVDYFDSAGDPLDFSEGEVENALPYYGSYRTANDGKLNVTTASTGNWHGETYWVGLSFDCSYYTQISIRLRALGGTENFRMLVYTGTGYYTPSTAITSDFATFEFSNPATSGTATQINIIYWNDTYIYSNAGEGVEIDFIRVLHVDSPVLNEYSSYFYLSSENNTLSYNVTQDDNFLGVYSDLEVIPKNLTTGVHDLTYATILDGDEQRVYLAADAVSQEYESVTALAVAVSTPILVDGRVSLAVTTNHGDSEVYIDDDSKDGVEVNWESEGVFSWYSNIVGTNNITIQVRKDLNADGDTTDSGETWSDAVTYHLYDNDLQLVYANLFTFTDEGATFSFMTNYRGSATTEFRCKTQDGLGWSGWLSEDTYNGSYDFTFVNCDLDTTYNFSVEIRAYINDESPGYQYKYLRFEYTPYSPDAIVSNPQGINRPQTTETTTTQNDMVTVSMNSKQTVLLTIVLVILAVAGVFVYSRRKELQAIPQAVTEKLTEQGEQYAEKLFKEKEKERKRR